MALLALNAHFQAKVSKRLNSRWELIDTEQDEVLQTAISKCDEIVAHESVRKAIDEVGNLIVEITPDQNEKVFLPGSEVIHVCEEFIGIEFRRVNQWKNWIAGN